MLVRQVKRDVFHVVVDKAKGKYFTACGLKLAGQWCRRHAGLDGYRRCPACRRAMIERYKKSGLC
jgi:hypothetical protein